MTEHDFRDVEVACNGWSVKGKASGFLTTIPDGPNYAMAAARGWFEVAPEEAARLGIREGDAVKVTDPAAGRRYAAIIERAGEVTLPRSAGVAERQAIRYHFQSSGKPTPLAPPPVAEGNPAEKPLDRRLADMVAKEKERAKAAKFSPPLVLPPGMTAKKIAGAMPGAWVAVGDGGVNTIPPDQSAALADLTRRVEALEAALKAKESPQAATPRPARRKRYDGWEGRSLSSGERVELWDAALGDYNPNLAGVVEHSSWEEDAVQYVTEYRVRLGLTRVLAVRPDELRPAGGA